MLLFKVFDSSWDEYRYFFEVNYSQNPKNPTLMRHLKKKTPSIIMNTKQEIENKI